MAYFWYFNLGTYVVLVVGCAIAWEIDIKISWKNRNRAHWFTGLMSAVFWMYVDKMLTFIIPEVFFTFRQFVIICILSRNQAPKHCTQKKNNPKQDLFQKHQSLNASTVPRIPAPAEINTFFPTLYHTQWEVSALKVYT